MRNPYLCTLVVLVSAVLAQAQAPPKFHLIVQESVKPGKSAAHEKVEAGWPRAFAKAKVALNYLGAVTLSGPRQAWFFIGYDSMTEWEKSDRDLANRDDLRAETDRLDQQDGDLLSGIRSLWAVHRDDLSLGANTVDWPKVRFVSIEIGRLKPGYEDEYGEVRKLFNAAHPKVGMDHHHLIYQVVSGVPGPFFMMISPLQTREEAAQLSPGFWAALGEEGQRKDRELSRTGVINYEALLLEISPRMSYPPQDWVKADPAFWAPKPKPAPAAKADAKVPAKQ